MAETITQHQAAVVCYQFDIPGGYPGSGFTGDLVALMARAKAENLDLLGLGFPGYVAAVRLAQGDERACERLSAIAQGQAPPEGALT